MHLCMCPAGEEMLLSCVETPCCPEEEDHCSHVCSGRSLVTSRRYHKGKQAMLFPVCCYYIGRILTDMNVCKATTHETA
jgi:hypothetical protein